MEFELCGSTEFFSKKCYTAPVDSADVGLWMVVDVTCGVLTAWAGRGWWLVQGSTVLIS